jgi:hypothetical protein
MSSTPGSMDVIVRVSVTLEKPHARMRARPRSLSDREDDSPEGAALNQVTQSISRPSPQRHLLDVLDALADRAVRGAVSRVALSFAVGDSLSQT